MAWLHLCLKKVNRAILLVVNSRPSSASIQLGNFTLETTHISSQLALCNAKQTCLQWPSRYLAAAAENDLPNHATLDEAGDKNLLLKKELSE